MADRRREGGLSTRESNLPLFREISAQMYNSADPKTRAKYEADAQAFNAKLKEPPQVEEIYKYVGFDKTHTRPSNRTCIGISKISAHKYRAH